MKKAKKKYSMTAKERKIVRELNNKSELTPEEVAAKKLCKKKRRSIILIVLASVFAVLLILTAIFLPPYIEYVDMRNTTKNPIAVIKLDNGKTIRLELFYDDAPIAVTNFIYLAQKDYFDNVIIHDNTNKFVRFGGYESATYDRETKPEYYNYHFTHYEKQNKKLNYRLKNESKLSKDFVKTAGYISYLTETATEFEMCTVTGSQEGVSVGGGTASQNLPARAFGYIYDNASLQVIIDIANMEQADRTDSSITMHKFWTPPKSTIKIKDVKILNIQDKSLEKVDFEAKMTELKGLNDYWTTIDRKFGL